MVNPVNLNNPTVNPNTPGTNANPNSALPGNGGNNQNQINVNSFAAVIAEVQQQENNPANGKVNPSEGLGHGGGVHGHHHHHGGGDNDQYMGSIANLGLTNPTNSNSNNTNNTNSTTTTTDDQIINNDENLFDTLV